jgi:hypothetical protein
MGSSPLIERHPAMQPCWKASRSVCCTEEFPMKIIARAGRSQIGASKDSAKISRRLLLKRQRGIRFGFTFSQDIRSSCHASIQGVR